MGKVREQFSNVEGLAQWVGRKVKNHQPMSVRVKGKATVGRVKEDTSKVIYKLADGQVFCITVEQISSNAPLPELIAVGA